MSKDLYSIAIETSCRTGGVALGKGDTLLDTRELGPGGRHASSLPVELDDLVRSRGIRPEQVAEAYVSTGPGSYTGIRVSLAFVRTLGQLMPQLKLVAVPTALAVAENVASRQWENLGVLLAARENIPWGVQVGRDESGNPKFTGQPVVSPIEDLIDRWGTPLLLTGEGLGYCEIPELEGVEIVEQKDRFPSIKSVWAVGRRLANSNKYVNFSELLPRYARRPEAVRLWEQRKDKA